MVTGERQQNTYHWCSKMFHCAVTSLSFDFGWPITFLKTQINLTDHFLCKGGRGGILNTKFLLRLFLVDDSALTLAYNSHIPETKTNSIINVFINVFINVSVAPKSIERNICQTWSTPTLSHWHAVLHSRIARKFKQNSTHWSQTWSSTTLSHRNPSTSMVEPTKGSSTWAPLKHLFSVRLTSLNIVNNQT